MHEYEIYLPRKQPDGHAVSESEIDGIKRELEQVFSRHGVTRIQSIGEALDPHKHQAMMEIPSDKAPGTIVEEMQPGYMIRDRLLRPALVGVAKKP